MILQAEKRETMGRKVKSIRENGLIPAVLYGHNIPTISLSVPYKEFEQAYKSAGESSVFALKVSEEKTPRNVLIHDISLDPRMSTFSHVDFYEVKMDEKIRTKVAFEFTGASLSEKEGNILVKNMYEIEVEAFPQDLPKSITVDIVRLAKLGDRILVSDLALGDKIKIIGSTSAVIALTEAPRTEEEMNALKETPIAEDLSAIKTEKEEKKEKEDIKEGLEKAESGPSSPAGRPSGRASSETGGKK